MNTLIIFDLDGTLADTRADLSYAVNLTRKSYSLKELSLEEIITHVGGGRRNLIERTFSDAPGIDIDEASDRWSDFYYKNLTVQTCLYAGVLSGLKALSERKYHLAVLSNKPGDMCREITAHFGLDKYLVATMGGGDAATVKPEPEGVYEIISRAETRGFTRNADNIWMIGDHYTDLKVAENAEIKSIFCNYGFGDRKGLRSDFDVSSFAEILDILD